MGQTPNRRRVLLDSTWCHIKGTSVLLATLGIPLCMAVYALATLLPAGGEATTVSILVAVLVQGVKFILSVFGSAFTLGLLLQLTQVFLERPPTKRARELCEAASITPWLGVVYHDFAALGGVTVLTAPGSAALSVEQTTGLLMLLGDSLALFLILMVLKDARLKMLVRTQGVGTNLCTGVHRLLLAALRAVERVQVLLFSPSPAPYPARLTAVAGQREFLEALEEGLMAYSTTKSFLVLATIRVGERRDVELYDEFQLVEGALFPVGETNTSTNTALPENVLVALEFRERTLAGTAASAALLCFRPSAVLLAQDAAESVLTT